MKLIYLVTEDWYFLSHRLPMAKAAQAAGFDVSVACRCTAQGMDSIRGAGFGVHPLSWRRSDTTVLGALRAIADIRRLYLREKPDVVHHVAMKPVVLGGIAALLARVPGIVSAIAGMGHLFISGKLSVRLMRIPVRLAMRAIFARRGSLLVLQNPDDRWALIRAGMVPAQKAVVIRGSGVDTERFRSLSEPEGPVTMAYVGRMLGDKGVRTLVEAQKRLWQDGMQIRLLLAGPADVENPTAVPAAELERWKALPGVSWLGPVSDVREVWKRAHVAVLMSLREGLPKCLLEAAACGRPIIASDVPGCREIAVAGENALLVPAGDVSLLADAMTHLAANPALRQRFGEASRRLAEGEFSEQNVKRKITRVYEAVMKERVER
ncbi:MAG: glycosyl transferase family 1 [Alphaproteobacteria bacterium GWF2_58_20]|nr:MAG: glycosyl transferase family 1 [Alphaproteobacteria bacterium GWF2_58_20]